MTMSKYINEIMDKVHYNFRNHFTELEKQKDFLRHLIEELSQEYNYIEYIEEDIDKTLHI